MTWQFFLSMLFDKRYPQLGAFLRWLDHPTLYPAVAQSGRAAPVIGGALAPGVAAALPSSIRFRYVLCSALDWFWLVVLWGIDVNRAESAGRAGGRHRSTFG